MFTKSNLEGEPQDFYESRRGQELAPILREADICLDLHATNKPSDPFICIPSVNEQKKEILRWFDCKNILVDPDFVIGGQPVATDDFTESGGGIGLVYEAGWVQDTSKIDSVMVSVLGVLADQGLIQDDDKENPGKFDKSIYKLVEAVCLTEAGWAFADDRGLGSFESFVAGDVLGHIGDQSFRAEYDGVIVFPKIKEHQKIGHPVCFLASRVT